MTARVHAMTIQGAYPTARRSLVIEETRAGDGVQNLWVAQNDGDGQSVLLTIDQLHGLIATLTERVAVLEGRMP
jgi:hypothetical protein